MSLNNIQSLQQRFADYRACVGRLRQEALQRGNDQALALLNKTWLRLRQGPVRTLVLGVSSAGKSTLINAMSGQVVVPEGKRTTSPIPVWVYNRNATDMPVIRILRSRTDDIEEVKCGRYGYLQDYCYTADQAGKGEGQEQFRDLVAATVNVNAPALAGSGITLIDTPGIGVSQGDNARVDQILKEGCEALIVLFRTLQEQEVQSYFRDLLVEEDAPLRNLIEEDRVFLVQNLDKKSYKISRLDTRNHVKNIFDGWECEDRLFTMNVRDARLTTCGIYSYFDLLPKGYSDEEGTHAEKMQMDEMNRIPQAKQQEGLDLLSEALEEMAENICADSGAVGRIIHPIEVDLHRACQMLKEPFLKQMEQIRNTVYPATREQEQRLRELTEKYDSIMEFGQKLAGKMELLQNYAERSWPATRILNGISLDSQYLLTDDTLQADPYLVAEIRKDNGPGSLVMTIDERMEKRIELLCQQLADPGKNPEKKYWNEQLGALCAFLWESCCDGNDRMELEAAQDLDVLREQLSDIPRLAQHSAEQALWAAGPYELTSEERKWIQDYLLAKQPKARQDGLFGGWSRFWLWPTFSTDRLDPLVRKYILLAKEVYIREFRRTVEKEYQKLYPGIRENLVKICVEVARLRDAQEREIREYKEACRQADIEKIMKEIRRLDGMLSVEKG